MTHLVVSVAYLAIAIVLLWLTLMTMFNILLQGPPGTVGEEGLSGEKGEQVNNWVSSLLQYFSSNVSIRSLPTLSPPL
jgi:hypothetical protein